MSNTFNITNIAPNLKEMTMTVFYQFSNGDVHSHTVPADTPVTEILAKGQETCVWFEEREEKMKEMQEQLMIANDELLDNPIEE